MVVTWDEGRCIRATWEQEREELVLYKVLDKTEVDNGCKLAVPMTRRNAFKAELGGCSMSLKNGRRRKLTFEILAEVVQRE